MTNSLPFNVGDLVFSEASEIDFAEFENAQLVEIYNAYKKTHPEMAINAAYELWLRSRRGKADEKSTVELFEETLVEGAASDEVMAATLDYLYGLDRARAQRIIIDVIESCGDEEVLSAADALGPDIPLYPNDPEFAKAKGASPGGGTTAGGRTVKTVRFLALSCIQGATRTSPAQR